MYKNLVAHARPLRWATCLIANVLPQGARVSP